MRHSMIATQNRDSLKPQPGESFERFSIRAHRLLKGRIADPMRRNEAIRRYWSKCCGATEAEKLARQRFTPDKYDLVTDVCVFAEHETRGEDGQVRHYGLKELAGIVRNCNERIVDVDAFPAIADGHTKDDEQAEDPAVLGYAGNFRLGMIGRKTPRWAIFCDEYRLRDARPTLNSKPRRSVELWTYKDTGRSHFDPIAALGAEAPRLPLPVRFSTVRRGDATLERYSAAAAPGAMASFSGAHPGGGNTFVKKPLSGGGRRKKPAKYQQENCAMLSPEDKAELVDALSSLPQFQFLDRLMNSPQGQQIMDGGLSPEDAAGAEQMAADEAEDDQLDPMPGGDGLTDDLDGLPMGGDGDEDLGGLGGDAPDPAGDMSDLDDVLGAGDEEEANPKKFQQHYAARASKAIQAERQRYSALASSHKKLLKEHGGLLGRVQAIERERTDAKRAAAIERLASEYPHFIDTDEEKQKALYSAGSSMTDAQFDQHVAQLERYAQRSSPVTRMLPEGEVRRVVPDRERYAAEESALAVKIATRAVDSGNVMTWDAAMAEARKQLGRS